MLIKSISEFWEQADSFDDLLNRVDLFEPSFVNAQKKVGRVGWMNGRKMPHGASSWTVLERIFKKQSRRRCAALWLPVSTCRVRFA